MFTLTNTQLVTIEQSKLWSNGSPCLENMYNDIHAPRTTASLEDVLT